MKLKLLILFFWLLSSSSFAAEKIKPNLYPWIQANIAQNTRMPLSFQIPQELQLKNFQNMGPEDSLTAIMERMITEQGISIYDAALWQMALIVHGDEEDVRKAFIPIKYYWDGNLAELTNIRAGYPDQPFMYDDKNPLAVSSSLSQKGSRGFIFRILNAYGRYNSHDPLDGKMYFAGFPNWPTVHWEDWKPIAGENAWVTMAAIQLHHKKFFDTVLEKYTSKDSIEMRLARELTKAALLLQAENGGVRMAPIGTYYSLDGLPVSKDLDVIVKFLDSKVNQSQCSDEIKDHCFVQIGESVYPLVTAWYYNEISTENNLSWYSAFKMMHQVTGRVRYKQAMLDIERYFQSVWNTKEFYFFQGSHFNGTQWVANKEHFASDVQNWAIVVIGPEKIDEWFGEGSAMKIWQTTKKFAGYYGKSGEIEGVGFTKDDGVLSVEWTGGAILAVKILAEYYAADNPDWAEEAKNDMQTMRTGVDQFLYGVDHKFAYSYSSQRGWIPFGWFSHSPEVLSMASTCWIYFIDQEFNPFELVQ